MVDINSKYIIRKNQNNTILIDIKNNSDTILFDGVGKIIIDNISQKKEKVVKLITKKYSKVEINIIEKDYDEFIDKLIIEGIINE